MQQRPPFPQAFPGQRTARVPACAHSLPLHTGQVLPTACPAHRSEPDTHGAQRWARGGGRCSGKAPIGGLLDVFDHLLADG